MSIARALSNAMSGLTAVSKGTETVAANVANAATPGYARREVMISPQGQGGNAGGVRIDGIARIVTESVLAESRSAASAQSHADTIFTFNSQMEKLVGLPAELGSLSTRFSDFQTALLSASSRPDDELRLTMVIDAAQEVVNKLNSLEKSVQDARNDADAAIARDVTTLNASLEQVAYLNRRISIISAEGGNASSLMDQRQAMIDQIALIVPVQTVTRDQNQIALFTTEGAVLLDGSQPNRLQFQPAGHLTAGQTVESGSAGVLHQDGVALSAGAMNLYAGGSLAAHFAIRDEHGPQLQQKIDALAHNLYTVFADPSIDPSLSAGEPGFFTNSSAGGLIVSGEGLAGRISVNSSLLSDPWRIRAGIGSDNPVPAADSSQLMRFLSALSDPMGALSSESLDDKRSMLGQVSDIEASVVTARVVAEVKLAMHNSRYESITKKLFAEGVNTDVEMQKLLEYEQAYAANARIIQAVDEMINHILRL